MKEIEKQLSEAINHGFELCKKYGDIMSAEREQFIESAMKSISQSKDNEIENYKKQIDDLKESIELTLSAESKLGASDDVIKAYLYIKSKLSTLK